MGVHSEVEKSFGVFYIEASRAQLGPLFSLSCLKYVQKFFYGFLLFLFLVLVTPSPASPDSSGS